MTKSGRNCLQLVQALLKSISLCFYENEEIRQTEKTVHEDNSSSAPEQTPALIAAARNSFYITQNHTAALPPAWRYRQREPRQWERLELGWGVDTGTRLSFSYKKAGDKIAIVVLNVFLN